MTDDFDVDPVDKALALWGLQNASARFVAGRENRVYRVEDASGTYALRLRRPGYRGADELASELHWLFAMADAGLNVPEPQKSLTGALMEPLGERHVDLLEWLSGKPLGQSRDPLELDDSVATFRDLGRMMAKLHNACDAWQRPSWFKRCHWNLDGFLGEAPLWGRFWENPTLDVETRTLLAEFREKATADLAAVQEGLDYGLVHGDLVRENVMVDGDQLSMIDFDDGGFGFRLFDVATALIKNLGEPNFPDLQAALIGGYRECRPLDDRHLPLFMGLRAVTYVGWIVPRMEEEGSPARNIRFINTARDLCGAYLNKTA